jgi:hypothetical protein
MHHRGLCAQPRLDQLQTLERRPVPTRVADRSRHQQGDPKGMLSGWLRRPATRNEQGRAEYQCRNLHTEAWRDTNRGTGAIYFLFESG